MSSTKNSILFVTEAFVGLDENWEIGTAYTNLARLLAIDGWEVSVLYAGPTNELAGHRIAEYFKQGIKIRLVQEFEADYEHWKHLDSGNPDFAVLSQKVLDAIKSLTRNERFDLVEFAEFRGMGFRTCQAYRNGMLDKTAIVTKLHSSSQWIREANDSYLPYGREHALLDYYERYSFSNAKYKTYPGEHMLSWASKAGWDVSDANLVRYAIPVRQQKHLVNERTETQERVKEVVFLGRLEPQNGLFLFIDALTELSTRDIKFSFLGKNVELDQYGLTAAELVRRRLNDFDVNFLMNLDRDEALAYLSKPGRIAVMDSAAEHVLNAVIECVIQEIPFLVSDVGGTSEILNWLQVSGDHLFPATIEGLVGKLRGAIEAPANKFRSRPDLEFVAGLNRAICEQYAGFADPFSKERKKTRAVKTERPLVTVGVPYYNMGPYVRDTLDSLAKQDYDNYEVLVVDDGSTEEMSQQIIDECKVRHPDFKFFQTLNQGLGAARNFLVSQARGSIFIPVDADNVPLPQMISRFSECMAFRPSLTAASCYLGRFEDGFVPSMANVGQVFMPNGGPKFLALVENVLGDANSAFRTSWLKENRFSEDRAVGIHDWELLLRLINQEDAELDVIPEILVYYRVRKGSMISTSSNMVDYNLLARTLSRITNRTDWEDFHKILLLISLPAVHNAAVKDLFGSWSWRLTAPLRWGFNSIFRRDRK